jgi:PAS domain S-box-containing protein
MLSEAERIAHVGSWFVDFAGQRVHWSDELYRILGYDVTTEPSYERFFARIHPEDRARIQQASAQGRASASATHVSCRILRPDGVIRHVSMDAAVVLDEAGRPRRAVGAILDVTEAYEAAEALKRTAHFLAEAQRIGKMGSFEWHVNSDEAICSAELYRVLDIDPATPPSVGSFLQRLHDDDRARITRLTERARVHGLTEPTRARIVYRDGSIRHLDMVAVAERAQSGELVIRGTVADITELVKLEGQFHQSQKMQAVGQLAGGLAHDYNNLLMIISGNAELLLMVQPDSVELREIAAAATAATTLTSRLLAFGRQTAQRERVARLSDDIEESKGLVQRALGDRIVMYCALEIDEWPVFVDSGQIQQILLNLALNARDAMPEGGTFQLKTQNQLLRATSAAERGERAGQYVVLSVGDSGTGMDEAVRARVFEPFFTTKDAGRGTGLGLAMVFGAMKRCGGFVEVESRPGDGSTFVLWFPRAAHESERAITRRVAGSHADVRVLLVEDNPAVADVTRRMLESSGYRVQVCCDPEQVVREWPQVRAQVLVTDIEMPGLSGIRLSERLRELTPELRTLFMTGHASERVDVTGECAVLMKPFSRGQLMAALHGLLA